jgi:radical SAM protein with 4Fe4S-binding SPASM domain
MQINKMGIDIVHGCQLRCIGCPNSTLKPRIIYCDTDILDACLHNLDVKKIRKLRLYNYGEPLLHPHLDKILLIISRQSFKINNVEITTNAQYWNEEVFTKAFSLGVVTQLYVSCDGNATSDDYERLRPPAKWDKLIAFMKNMRRLRDTVCPDMFLGTRTICTDKKDRDRWKKLLKQLGYKPEFRPWGTRADALEKPWGKVRIPRGICRYLTKAKGLRLYVDYDGTVVPCCVHPRAGVLGNLVKSKYSDILKSDLRNEFIKVIKKNRALIPACIECQEK